jgi:Flp pilus assembly protein TadB
MGRLPPPRALAIALLAAGAVAAGLGNSTGQGWLVALAFCCFFAAVFCIMRWRRAERARVFDREEKTRE